MATLQERVTTLETTTVPLMQSLSASYNSGLCELRTSLNDRGAGLNEGLPLANWPIQIDVMNCRLITGQIPTAAAKREMHESISPYALSYASLLCPIRQSITNYGAVINEGTALADWDTAVGTLECGVLPVWQIMCGNLGQSGAAPIPQGWSMDTFYDPYSEYGSWFTLSIDISTAQHPAPLPVYQGIRNVGSGMPVGAYMTYSFTGLDVNAAYFLRYHFFEPSTNQAGQRYFWIQVYGRSPLSVPQNATGLPGGSIDVAGSVGQYAGFSIDSQVMQCRLDGTLTQVWQQGMGSPWPPIISGIELYSVPAWYGTLPS